MPLSDAQIQAHVLRASESLQALQDEFGRDNVPAARVRFPRGFIRTVGTIRATLPNLGTELQRRNACYSLMQLDVLRWLLVRTDISGTALSMTVKQGIVILGGLCEWLTREATHGHGSKRKFEIRTERLIGLGVIDQALKTELDWVWEMRCNAHIGEVEHLEHSLYRRDDYNRARTAYASFRDALVEVYGTP